MLAALATAALALRAGLALRGARRGLRRAAPGARGRHLRLAKSAVLALLVGFLGGPISMAWLRGRDPFETAHALLGSLAAALFVATALLGLRLERARAGSRPLDAHAALGALALLMAAAAAVAGFVLLP